MQIDVKKPNRISQMIHQIKSGFHDIVLNVLLRMPAAITSSKTIEKYLNRQLQQLQSDQVKLEWKNVILEKYLDEVREDK